MVGIACWPSERPLGGPAVLSPCVQPVVVSLGSVRLHLGSPTVDAFLQSQGGRGGRIWRGSSCDSGASSCPSLCSVFQMCRWLLAHRTFAHVRAEWFVWLTPFKLSHVIAADTSGFVWLGVFQFQQSLLKWCEWPAPRSGARACPTLPQPLTPFWSDPQASADARADLMI